MESIYLYLLNPILFILLGFLFAKSKTMKSIIFTLIAFEVIILFWTAVLILTVFQGFSISDQATFVFSGIYAGLGLFITMGTKFFMNKVK